MKNLIVFLVFSSFLSGCTSNYQQTRSSTGGSDSAIPASASVYVGTPPDGRYGATVYNGSGIMTAQAFVSAFASTVKEVKSSPGIVTRETGLSQTRKEGFDFYAEPKILHWEDRATE